MASARNYIVVRHSPDWLTFDIESSRAFLRSLKVEENVVVDFAAIWDRAFAVEYRHFRERIKDISIRNYEAVANASVIGLEAFQRRRLNDDDLVVFIDDDDWLRPDLFDVLRASSPSADGARWGNIIIGGEFKGDATTAVSARQIEIRPIIEWLYTNNYALSGAALKRVGIPAILEHLSAQQTMLAGRYKPAVVRRYLSATNKHPCSTIAARRYLGIPEFRIDPRAVIARQRDALVGEPLNGDTQWTAPLVTELVALLDDALRA